MPVAGTTSRLARAVLALVAAALIVAPVLGTGFYGDDASDANLNGALALRHVSLLQATVATAALWVEANGRLFPAYVAEKYAVFHLLPGVVAYKLFLYALTLAVIVVFMAFVRRMGGGGLGALAGFFVALCLQMRGYHDALYAYNGMIQIMLLVLLASLWCWRVFLERGGAAWAVAAVVLYAGNCLTYEFSYLFFPLYALVSPATAPRALLRAGGPFAALSALAAITAVLLRAHAAIASSSAYAIGRSPVAYATALLQQLAAALPLSYYGWNPSGIFPRPPHLFDGFGGYAFDWWVALFCAAVAFVLVRGVAQDAARDTAWPLRRLLWLGLGLWLLPAPLVALSVKYQRELQWGIGYLPVLIEVFGVALVLTVATAALLRAARPPGRVAAVAAIALACGFAGAVTLADNQRLARELLPWRVSRAVVGAALARGVVRAVPDGTTVGMGGDLPWLCLAESGCPDDLDSGYFVYAKSGKQLQLTTLGAADAAWALRYGATPRVAWVAAARRDGANGAIYLEALGGNCIAAGGTLTRFARMPERLSTGCGAVELGDWPG
jgi:hypothetical protein